MEVRADVVFSELEVLREIRQVYGTAVELGPTLQERLREMAVDRRRREAMVDFEMASGDHLAEELTEIGFQRELRPFQLENLARIVGLPHAADFSVPGAGKTTVSLACFALLKARQNVEQLLVVAPLAAFSSWKEDGEACLGSDTEIAVHMGPGQSMPVYAGILLTNYHRLAADYDRLRSWVAARPTQVVLDEAHRVKRGRDGVHGTAALDLAFASRRRDVLTGTPAPQGASDIVALIQFLYPGQARQILPQETFVERMGRNRNVLDATHRAVRRYFVRTPKSRLDLPPTSIEVIAREMGPVQSAIYEALRGMYSGNLRLERDGRRSFQALGRITMYMLEAATNPLLIVAGSDEADLPVFRHPPLDLTGHEHLRELLHGYAEYEMPWKYAEVQRMVYEAAESGQKVLVWSSFVRNIRFLARLLESFHPAVVHGAIPPEDGAAPGVTTREQELDRFRFDPACTVLLANPAACGEGVSLHHWCHHAIYLDRSFNAGHYLQSQDRIHRLGLAPDVVTQFSVLVSRNSVDEIVHSRLAEKIAALAVLMDDPGLVTVSLPSDELPYEAEDSGLSGDERDVRAIVDHMLLG
jgi:hypothetical protein